MIYNKLLPRVNELIKLKSLSKPFPTTAGIMLEIATLWNFPDSTIDFLKIFPADEIFESGEDFLTQCEETKLLIREERMMPAEVLSSQD